MTPLPLELRLLGWSVLLLFAHLFLQGQLMTRERGVAWGAGARDGGGAPLGPVAGRAARALRNFGETYPAFVGLALALVVSDRAGGIGATGAALWFGARVAYIPLYLLGLPWLRSLGWLASAAGLLLMLARLLGAA